MNKNTILVSENIQKLCNSSKIIKKEIPTSQCMATEIVFENILYWIINKKIATCMGEYHHFLKLKERKESLSHKTSINESRIWIYLAWYSTKKMDFGNKCIRNITEVYQYLVNLEPSTTRFLDLKKVFDILNYSILIIYGIEPK